MIDSLNVTPLPGAKMYVGPADDRLGGIATIASFEVGVSAGKPTYFVRMKEGLGRLFNFTLLMKDQERLERAFAGQKARLCLY